MVRKTKEETEKTRRAILDSALDVFSSKGFVRSTLGDIAKAAGVTRGAIYWHFKDKVDLFEALNEEMETCSHTSREDMMRESFQSLEEIGEKMLGWLELLETNERFRTFYEFINFKIEYHQELDRVLAKQRKHKRAILERFTNDYTNLQKAGRVRPEIDPYRAALMTMFFFRGMVDIWLFDQELFSIKEMGKTMIEKFLRRFEPEPAVKRG